VGAHTRAHVWVSGVVQGVFFRGTTAEQARALGLDGWVRNLPDGRVEAVFQGDATNVGAAVEWVRHGPPRAIVESVETVFEPLGPEIGFRVR
jgi:acylphosphatase